MKAVDLESKIKDIERILRDHANTSDEMNEVVKELEDIVHELDKSVALNGEKQSQLAYKIEVLNQKLSAVEMRGEKGSDKQRALVENALMVVLGGLLSYIFSLANK